MLVEMLNLLMKPLSTNDAGYIHIKERMRMKKITVNILNYFDSKKTEILTNGGL